MLWAHPVRSGLIEGLTLRTHAPADRPQVKFDRTRMIGQPHVEGERAAGAAITLNRRDRSAQLREGKAVDLEGGELKILILCAQFQTVGVRRVNLDG